MQDTFRNPNKVVVLALPPFQQTAWWWRHFGPGGIWEDALLEKYGPWRVAQPGEEGIPCVEEVYA